MPSSPRAAIASATRAAVFVGDPLPPACQARISATEGPIDLDLLRHQPQLFFSRNDGGRGTPVLQSCCPHQNGTANRLPSVGPARSKRADRA